MLKKKLLVKVLSGLRLISDETYLSILHRRKIGSKLDLINPKTFTEKIQWLKINDRSSLHTICADKYQVRKYVSETIGKEYLIPMVGAYDCYNDIPWEKLPSAFALKGNHGSGMNIICFDKSTLKRSDVRDSVNFWLNQNFHYRTREWQYKNIPPKITIEELLIDSDGNVPSDIKVHCFKKPDGSFEQIIQMDLDRFGTHKQGYYDTDWNLLDIKFFSRNFSAEDVSVGNVDKPSRLFEILELSSKLASPFCYSRIDFFLINEKIYFGEVTFHHHSGLTKLSNHWNERLGSLIDLSLV